MLRSRWCRPLWFTAMRAVYFLGDRQAEVREAPDPIPGADEVVVALRASTICGSDLHRYRGPAQQPSAAPPTAAGHSAAGVVAEIGAAVSGVAEGDRVSVYQYLGCGDCRHCRAGNVKWCSQRRVHGHQADGSFADRILTYDRNCQPLPEDLSFQVGALMACTLVTAYQALTRVAPSGHDRLVVFGLGPLGLATLLLARAMGGEVIGVDLSAPRLALAREFGAMATVDAANEDIARRVQELTDGEGADVGIEASGAVAAQQQLIETLRRGGRGCVIGMGSTAPSVNLTVLIGKHLTLHGSHVAPATAYQPLADLVQQRHVPADQLVTHRYPLEKALEALRLADSASTGVVAFTWPE